MSGHCMTSRRRPPLADSLPPASSCLRPKPACSGMASGAAPTTAPASAGEGETGFQIYVRTMRHIVQEFAKTENNVKKLQMVLTAIWLSKASLNAAAGAGFPPLTDELDQLK